MHPYVNVIIQKISETIETQSAVLEEAANKLAESVRDGGILHVLGTGHSHMIAEELFYRAGGVLFINPILDPALMLHQGPTKSTRFERLPGYAHILLQDINFNENDVFLIVSNSGRNSLPVEAALYAKEKGLLTFSITSLAHSTSVESRHSSGKRLFEITDYVFDNKGEIGDTSLSLDDGSINYGPTSSVIGIVLVQTLISMTIEKLVELGVAPPMLQSANLDDSDAKNQKAIKAYFHRIPLLS